jgi:hypothetical protein
MVAGTYSAVQAAGHWPPPPPSQVRPFDAGCSPLSYSGNPGVNWRISQGGACRCDLRWAQQYRQRRLLLRHGGLGKHRVGEQQTDISQSKTDISQSKTDISQGEAALAAGMECQAVGDNSVAIGRKARASEAGAMVLTDGQDTWTYGSTANGFFARFAGGYYLYSASSTSTGVKLEAGSGSWSSLSDENSKRAFAEVNGTEILEQLGELSIRSWQYKSQAADIRHIGPTAQDFFRHFGGLGEDRQRISSVDADGVLMVSKPQILTFIRTLPYKIYGIWDR